MAERNENQPTFEDLELLADVSQLLNVTDINLVLRQVIELVKRAVGAMRTSLFLLQGSSVDWGHLFTKRDLDETQSVQVVSTVLETGFAGWVIRHKQGDIIMDTRDDARWHVFDDDPIHTRSVLCVPFIHYDEVVAIITLEHDDPNMFQPYHLRLVEIVANQATIAIQNAQLFSHLNAQRRQLSSVLDAMRDFLLVLDVEGNIEIANPAVLPLLGATNEMDVYDSPLEDFVAIDEVFSPIVEILNANLMGNESWTFESRSEKHQMDFQVMMSVWEDEQRDESGYVVVMHDVTELYDLSRFKDEMLRVASHDLRSPLALIAGYTDMISMDTLDEQSPVHEYVEIIKGVVERMGNLVDDLLRVERIRTSPLELHEQTDLTALVKLIAVNMRPAAHAKKMTFETHTDFPQTPYVIADPVLIRQAMENLISNAIKYTPEGGTIKVLSYTDAGKFHFRVEDNGIGIPEEHLKYLFETFYRVQSEKTKAHGTGLGLSLVKNVVRRHDGDVWVESVYGEGSTFGFWLPLTHVESQDDKND